MSEHQHIKIVVDRIHRDVIGGAADIAREVIQALLKLIDDVETEDIGVLSSQVEDAAVDIMNVMPSFAPPINAMSRMFIVIENGMDIGLSVPEVKKKLHREADNIFTKMENAISQIALYGAEIVKDGDVVFMYSMSSTVWRILKYARKQGKSFHVVVTESRPGNEGLWTVDEMLKENIPVSVSIDACIGELIPRANVVFVGADAISSTGYSYCKAGTYPAALVAKRHAVPFYVAADTLKFDSSTLLGLPFRPDPVRRDEVLTEKYPSQAMVVGTLFDETPPDLVNGIITEIGLMNPIACVTVMQEMKLSRFIALLLPDWVYRK